MSVDYPIERKASTWNCGGNRYSTFIVDLILLCISVGAIIANILVLASLVHLSHDPSAKRFQGIRRSLNRGHPHFRFKGRDSSKSLRLHTPQSNVKNFMLPGMSHSTPSNNSASIMRSPSCPDRLLTPSPPKFTFKSDKSRYWLSQLNIVQKKSFKSPPQPRPRLTTALVLVYCLLTADLINSSVTTLSLFASFVGAFVATDSMLQSPLSTPPLSKSTDDFHQKSAALIPCLRLAASSFLFTSYNAAIMSIVGLALDLYLGITHSMRYRVLPRRKLLKYIICGWLFALLLGSNHLFLPAIHLPNYNTTLSLNEQVSRHFLHPSEHCGPQPPVTDYLTNRYCYRHGSTNLYRSGFITGGLLVLSSLMINIMCGFALLKLRRQTAACKPGSQKAAICRRSASLPSINKVNGVVFALHGLRTERQPKSPPHCTTKQLLRSSFALLSLIAISIVFYAPSLALEIYTITQRIEQAKLPSEVIRVSRKPEDFPPWLYELISNLPVVCSLLNPIFYSLRLNDIRTGMRNLRKRIFARPQRNFIRKHLRLHKENMLMRSKLTAHLRIKLPPPRDSFSIAQSPIASPATEPMN